MSRPFIGELSTLARHAHGVGPLTCIRCGFDHTGFRPSQGPLVGWATDENPQSGEPFAWLVGAVCAGCSEDVSELVSIHGSSWNTRPATDFVGLELRDVGGEWFAGAFAMLSRLFLEHEWAADAKQKLVCLCFTLGRIRMMPAAKTSRARFRHRRQAQVAGGEGLRNRSASAA